MKPRVAQPIAVQLPPCGIAVVESHHAVRFTAPAWQHNFAKFILVLAGRGSLQAGARTLRLEPDTLLHVPARTPHRLADEPGQPVSLYVVCYRPADRLPLARWRLGAFAAVTRSDIREMLFEQAARLEAWELALHSRLGDLIVRARRGMTSSRPVVFVKGRDNAERVAAYALQLETRFYAAQSLDEAARSVGLSRRRFTQLFRAVTGQSWHARVQALRVRHARQLLAATTKSLINVAFECGYDDVSHFHRVFKRTTGQTPAAFRARSAATPE